VKTGYWAQNMVTDKAGAEASAVEAAG